MEPADSVCNTGGMNAKGTIRPPTKKNTKLPTTEVLDDASQDRVLQMLHDKGDLFWHHRIKNLFAEVGFATRRVEHEPHHPVWRVWLTRENCNLATDNDTANQTTPQNPPRRRAEGLKQGVECHRPAR